MQADQIFLLILVVAAILVVALAERANRRRQAAQPTDRQSDSAAGDEPDAPGPAVDPPLAGRGSATRRR